jgi:dUTPase
VVVKAESVEFEEAAELDETIRAAAGFGSTGVT